MPRPGKLQFRKPPIVKVARPSTPASGAILARAPLYINSPSRGWRAPDIFPNLAVFAAAVVVVISSPDTQAFQRRAPQIDSFPNVAVKLQTQQPAGKYLEPLLWKPAAPQIDVYPNIAVSLQTQRLAGTYIDPPRYLPVPAAPDIYPNIAVNLQTQQLAGEYLEPLVWKRGVQLELFPNLAVIPPVQVARVPAPIEPQLTPSKGVQPDLFPNLSAQTETVPVVRTPLYTLTWKSPAPQIDVYPNVAGLLTPSLPRFPVPVEPQLTKPLPLPPDIYPNLAAQTETVPVVRQPLYFNYKPINWAATTPDVYPNLAAQVVTPSVFVPRPMIEPAPWLHPAPQIEVFPNIALMLSPSIGNITAWNELPPGKWPAVDLYPNIAVSSAVYSPVAPIEPLLWKAQGQSDLYPNIAVRVTPLGIAPPIEPVFTSKVSLPPELFPNIAAKATAAAPVLILPMIEPTYTRRYTLQMDYFPNMAVGVPVVVPTGLHEIGLGFNWFRLGGRVGGN